MPYIPIGKNFPGLIRTQPLVPDPPDMIAFDSVVDAGNEALETTFSTSALLSFVKPDGWGTYKLQAEGWANVGGQTAGDVIGILLQITGDGATIFGGETVDNAPVGQTVIAYIESDRSLSQDVGVQIRVRNQTASRGTVFTSGIRLTAVRLT